MRTKISVGLLAAGLLFLGFTGRVDAQSSCSACVSCSSWWSCPPSGGQFYQCCGMGAEAGCTPSCTTSGDGCQRKATCTKSCPSGSQTNESRCDSSCDLKAQLGSPTQYLVMAGGNRGGDCTTALVALASAAFRPSSGSTHSPLFAAGVRSGTGLSPIFASRNEPPRRPQSSGYSEGHASRQKHGPAEVTFRPSPWGMEYVATFERPVGAFLLETTYTYPDGFVSRHTTHFDSFLREGSQSVGGFVGYTLRDGVAGEPEGRVRYVEYEDGTVDGNLNHSTAREAFEPLRAAVRDYARALTTVAQTGGRPAIEKALEGMQPGDLTARTARDTIAVHVKAVGDDAAILERLERLAQP
jgi:hypothetical protein